MALVSLTKQPGELLLYDMDFRKVMPAGVTLSGVSGVTQENQGIVSGSASLAVGSASASGTVAQVWLSGGTDLEDYKITITVTNSRGETVEGDGTLQVREL